MMSLRVLSLLQSRRLVLPKSKITSSVWVASNPVPETTINRTHSNGISGAARSFASYSPLDWWKNRQEAKEIEKYKARIAEMAKKKDWVIGDMLKELDEVKQSWASKIPGINQGKEIKMATTMHKKLSSLVEFVGADATVERLKLMTEKEKLQCAIAAESTCEDLAQLVDQFDIMCLMHRVVRLRAQQKLPIPETPEAMQLAIQNDGMHLMSKEQKTKMSERQTRSWMPRGAKVSRR